MDAKDEKAQEPVIDPGATDDDVEGHSVFSAIAVSGALRQRSPHGTDAASKKADEDLTPLSKPFPSMRSERRK